jgi:hypothetical protein
MADDVDYDKLASSLFPQPQGKPDGSGAGGGPGATDYDRVLNDMLTGQVGANLRAVQGTNADQAARAQALSRASGLPLPAVEGEEDRVEADLRRQSAEAALRDAPRVSTFFSEPNFAKVAHDDAENLGFLERTWSKISQTVTEEAEGAVRGFRRGMLTTDLRDVGRKLFWGKGTPEDEARVQELQKLQELDETDAFLGAAGEQLPIMGSIAGQALKRGLQTGMAFGGGVALLGQLGPQAALPEELVTVPAATMTGLAIGGRAGGLEAAWELETYLAFLEYRDLKTADGRPMDVDVARGAAMLAGTVNAGLEAYGFSSLVKRLPGVAELAKLGGRKQVAAAIGEAARSNPTLAATLATFGKRYVEGIAIESLTEMVQELSTASFAEVAKMWDGGAFKAAGLDEITERVIDAGVQAAKATAVLGMPGPAMQAVGERRRAAKAQRDAEAMREAGGIIDTSVLAQRDPERFGEVQGAILRDQGVDTIAIPAARLQELFQSEPGEGAPIDQATLMRNLGVTDEQMAEALAVGGDVHMTPEAFAQHVLADKATRAALVEHVRLGVDGMTEAEAKEWETTGLRDAIDDMASLLDSMDSGRRVEAARIEAEVESMMVAAGEARDTARYAAVLTAQRYSVRAERAGVSPLQLWQEDNLRVERLQDMGRRVDEVDIILDKARSPDTLNLSKTPILDMLARAGVDPNSPLGGELKAMGITAKTRPGLFKVGGRQAADNLPLAEMPWFTADDEDGTGNYVSEAAVLAAVRDELAGNPRRTADEQAQLDGRENDIRNLEADLERYNEMSGNALSVATSSAAEIRDALQELADLDARAAREALGAVGRVLEQGAAIERLQMVAGRGQRAMASRASISAEERAAIAASAQATGVPAKEILAAVRTHKLAHPVAQGWARLVYSRTVVNDGKVQHEYRNIPYGFSSDAEGSQLEPGSAPYNRRVAAIASAMAQEVRAVFRRAVAGDANARNILAQAGWYKAMRARLRKEFGGLGDLFADLLGATSPNTPVRDNWFNGVDALRRALRGDFDEIIDKWDAHFERVDALENDMRAWVNERLDEGQTKKAVKSSPEYEAKLTELREARRFPDELIPTKESGAKYGFNGRNVARAMVDLWRVVKNADPDIARSGTAPKALNFSGNLIGFRERATIDVWAARMLQRLAGGKRIPSMAETTVSGEMRQDGSTTLQFGFGQDVFARASAAIRGDAEMQADATLAKINDDDLQAVVWFVEKELWTINDWTNAAGEGGSFELEANLTGSFDQKRIKELRSIIDAAPPSADVRAAAEDTSAARQEIEAHERRYEAEIAELRGLISGEIAAYKGSKRRIAELQRIVRPPAKAVQAIAAVARAQARLEDFGARKVAAKAELALMEREVDRYVGGLSIQMSRDTQGVDYVPTDADMARLAEDIRRAIYEADDGATVLGSKSLSTEGRYGSVERALDLEVVAREGYDANALWLEMLRQAQAARQDATFLSRVLRDGEAVDPLRHRPGVEIYFRSAAAQADLEKLLADLAGQGVEFLTVVVDARRLAEARSGAMPAAVGVRLLYVPEFEQRYGIDDLVGLDDAALAERVSAKQRELSAIAARVAGSIDGVAFAGQFWYETKVAFSSQYQEKIDALATGAAQAVGGATGAAVWVGEPIRSGLEGADRHAGEAARGQSDGQLLGGDAQRADAADGQEGAGLRQTDGRTLQQSAAPQLPATIDVDGVARPTTNSEGRPIAQTEEGVRAFWRWFGDSKVVDAEGRPLVVYHGSPVAGFIEFDPSKINASDPDGPYNGFWFSSSQSDADVSGRYPWGRPNAANPETRDYYLALQNPATRKQARSVAREISSDWETQYPAARSLQDATRLALRARGFDGVVHEPFVIPDRETFERDGVVSLGKRDAELEREPDGSVTLLERGEEVTGYSTFDEAVLSLRDGVFVAFDPTQIKSATGNRGTFDPASASILEQRGSARGSIQFNAGATIIRLGANADRSTFLHESGHLYLEQLRADAARFGASNQQLADDLKTVNEWFASDAAAVRAEAIEYARKAGDDASVTALQAMTDAQVAAFARAGAGMPRDASPAGHLSRALHERWARGVEDYFRTGQAPSVALQDAFNRFRAWLVSIYAALRRRLGAEQLEVSFSPEVKAVMDRMLATDEEIALVEQQYNLRAMFATPEEANMSPERFAAYQKAVMAAGEAARTEQLRRHLREVERERASWWRAERAKLREEVAAEVRARPVFLAIHALAAGKMPDGQPIPGGLVQPRMDRAAVVALLENEKSLSRLPRVKGRTVYATAKGESGSHPDVVASFYGFDGGREMLIEMMNTDGVEKTIDRETDARMRERHGDMQVDGTAVEKAVESAHTDKRGDVLVAEINALQNGGGPAGGGRVRTAFLRQWARERIAGRKISELQPQRFLMAERKAGRDADRAMAAGDRAAALKAKFQQALNFHMAREAYKARVEIDKAIEYLSGFQRAGAKFPALEAGYVDQIRTILEAYQFGPPLSDRTRVKLEMQAVLDWIERQRRDAGAVIEVPQRILDADERTNYRTLSLDEFRTLRDTIKNLEAQGRLAKTALIDGEEMAISDMADQVVARVEQTPQLARMARRGVEQNPGVLDRARSKLASFDAALRKVELLIEQVDGQRMGPLWRFLFKPFSDAETARKDMTLQVTKRVMDALDNMPTRSRLAERINVPMLGRTFARSDLIMMALNVGNESNLAKMIEGSEKDITEGARPFTLEGVDSALANLTAEEWVFVQEVWDAFEAMWPQVQAVYRRENGVAPERVDAREIQTRYGQTLRGGYFPMMYDPARSVQARDIEGKSALEAMQSTVVRASVNSSMTKARTGFSAPVLLDITALPNHIERTAHFITHYEPVRIARKLLARRDVARAINNRVGPEYYDTLKAWVQELAANGQPVAPTSIGGRIVEAMRRNATVAIMGLSYTTMVAQVFGLANSIDALSRQPGGGYSPRRGTTAMLGGLVRYLSAPATVRRQVFAASGEMRHRLQNTDRDIRHALQQLSGKKGAWSQMQRFSMLGIAGIQLYMVDLPTWLAAYDQAIARGATTDEAVDAADNLLRTSQTAGGIKDLAAIQRERGVMTALTMFYSYFNLLYNLQRQALGNVGSARDVPQLAARAFILMAIPILVDALVKRQGPDEDKDETAAGWFAQKAAVYALSSLPFLRDLAGMAEGFGYKPTPLDGFGKALGATVKGIAQAIDNGELDAKALKAMVSALGFGAGVPATQVNRVISAADAMFEGEDVGVYDFLAGPKKDK